MASVFRGCPPFVGFSGATAASVAGGGGSAGAVSVSSDSGLEPSLKTHARAHVNMVLAHELREGLNLKTLLHRVCGCFGTHQVHLVGGQAASALGIHATKHFNRMDYNADTDIRIESAQLCAESFERIQAQTEEAVKSLGLEPCVVYRSETQDKYVMRIKVPGSKDIDITFVNRNTNEEPLHRCSLEDVSVLLKDETGWYGSRARPLVFVSEKLSLSQAQSEVLGNTIRGFDLKKNPRAYTVLFSKLPKCAKISDEDFKILLDAAKEDWLKYATSVSVSFFRALRNHYNLEDSEDRNKIRLLCMRIAFFCKNREDMRDWYDACLGVFSSMGFVEELRLVQNTDQIFAFLMSGVCCDKGYVEKPSVLGCVRSGLSRFMEEDGSYTLRYMYGLSQGVCVGRFSCADFLAQSYGKSEPMSFFNPLGAHEKALFLNAHVHPKQYTGSFVRCMVQCPYFYPYLRSSKDDGLSIYLMQEIRKLQSHPEYPDSAMLQNAVLRLLCMAWVLSERSVSVKEGIEAVLDTLSVLGEDKKILYDCMGISCDDVVLDVKEAVEEKDSLDDIGAYLEKRVLRGQSIEDVFEHLKPVFLSYDVSKRNFLLKNWVDQFSLMGLSFEKCLELCQGDEEEGCIKDICALLSLKTTEPSLMMVFIDKIKMYPSFVGAVLESYIKGSMELTHENVCLLLSCVDRDFYRKAVFRMMRQDDFVEVKKTALLEIVRNERGFFSANDIRKSFLVLIETKIISVLDFLSVLHHMNMAYFVDALFELMARYEDFYVDFLNEFFSYDFEKKDFFLNSFISFVQEKKSFYRHVFYNVFMSNFFECLNKEQKKAIMSFCLKEEHGIIKTHVQDKVFLERFMSCFQEVFYFDKEVFDSGEILHIFSLDFLKERLSEEGFRGFCEKNGLKILKLTEVPSCFFYFLGVFSDLSILVKHAKTRHVGFFVRFLWASSSLDSSLKHDLLLRMYCPRNKKPFLKCLLDDRFSLSEIPPSIVSDVMDCVGDDEKELLRYWFLHEREKAIFLLSEKIKSLDLIDSKEKLLGVYELMQSCGVKMLEFPLDVRKKYIDLFCPDFESISEVIFDDLFEGIEDGDLLRYRVEGQFRRCLVLGDREFIDALDVLIRTFPVKDLDGSLKTAMLSRVQAVFERGLEREKIFPWMMFLCRNIEGVEEDFLRKCDSCILTILGCFLRDREELSYEKWRMIFEYVRDFSRKNEDVFVFLAKSIFLIEGIEEDGKPMMLIHLHRIASRNIASFSLIKTLSDGYVSSSYGCFLHEQSKGRLWSDESKLRREFLAREKESVLAGVVDAVVWKQDFNKRVVPEGGSSSGMSGKYVPKDPFLVEKITPYFLNVLRSKFIGSPQDMSCVDDMMYVCALRSGDRGLLESCFVGPMAHEIIKLTCFEIQQILQGEKEVSLEVYMHVHKTLRGIVYSLTQGWITEKAFLTCFEWIFVFIKNVPCVRDEKSLLCWAHVFLRHEINQCQKYDQRLFIDNIFLEVDMDKSQDPSYARDVNFEDLNVLFKGLFDEFQKTGSWGHIGLYLSFLIKSIEMGSFAGVKKEPFLEHLGYVTGLLTSLEGPLSCVSVQSPLGMKIYLPGVCLNLYEKAFMHGFMCGVSGWEKSFCDAFQKTASLLESFRPDLHKFHMGSQDLRAYMKSAVLVPRLLHALGRQDLMEMLGPSYVSLMKTFYESVYLGFKKFAHTHADFHYTRICLAEMLAQQQVLRQCWPSLGVDLDGMLFGLLGETPFSQMHMDVLNGGVSSDFAVQSDGHCEMLMQWCETLFEKMKSGEMKPFGAEPLGKISELCGVLSRYPQMEVWMASEAFSAKYPNTAARIKKIKALGGGASGGRK
jgi:hypothetical protein